MSSLTLGCYLFPACVGLFLLRCLGWTRSTSDCNTKTRTMFLERRATLLVPTTHTLVPTGTLSGRMGNECCWGFPDGSVVSGVRYQCLTSEVRAHSSPITSVAAETGSNSTQTSYLLLMLLVSKRNVYLQIGKAAGQTPLTVLVASQCCCSHHHGDGMLCFKGER